MKYLLCTSLLVFAVSSSTVDAFTAGTASTTTSTATSHHVRKSNTLTVHQMSSNSENQVDLGLTPELERVTNAFAGIPDEQLRYKQLLYMAQNTKEANNMPDSSKTSENKVPGCLSTVYVDGVAEFDDEAGDYVINFIGDSDGLLTRGLVALLVRCLSGNTAEAIQKVDPQFIKVAQIEQSLTPGRNNGFLNMLRTMKQKALELDSIARAQTDQSPTKETSSSEDSSDSEPTSTSDATAVADGSGGEGGPKYNAIVTSLQALKPTSLSLIDNSHQHAGHAGNDMDGESHFELSIVAEAFEGLNLVKRHKLIYMILGDIMPQIHALQIQALTPEEAENRSN